MFFVKYPSKSTSLKMVTTGGRNMCDADDIYRAINPHPYLHNTCSLYPRTGSPAPSAVPSPLPSHHHSRRHALVTLWTNAVTGPRRRPSAPPGGGRMATKHAASGSGDRGGRELARTACHLPQGTKSLGRKVRVLFRLQYHACYTPRLPRTPCFDNPFNIWRGAQTMRLLCL